MRERLFTALFSSRDSRCAKRIAAVGETNVPTTNNLVAFYATISASSSTLKAFSSNGPSELWAMNASGLATGDTYYVPFGGFATSYPTVTSAGNSLAVLQPTCTTALAGCVQYPYYFQSTNGESRSITAGGTILAYAVNAANGQFIEATGGTHPSSVQFSLPVVNGQGAFNIRGMDDAGNVVFEQYDPTIKVYNSRIYLPKSKTVHTLGRLPNNSCTQYTPLYINGPGRVLGIAQSCSFASDQTYWTWDATNGIVAVTFSHTGYSAATLVLINDKGQIVADLTTSSGNVHHWGYLTPPATF